MTGTMPSSSLTVELQGIGPGVAIAAGLAMIVVAWWTYRRTASLTARRRGVLFLLRCVVCVLVAVLLTLPVVRREREELQAVRIVVVQDLSPSMRHHTASTDRDADRWLDDLRTLADVTVRTFGEDGRSPVLETLRQTIDRDVASGGVVILVSDGRDTAGGEADVVARQARASGVAVVVLEPESVQDTGVVDAWTDAIVFASDRATLRLALQSTPSFADREANVVVSIDGQEVRRQPVRLDATEVQRVEVVLPELAPGRRDVTVLLDSGEAETFPENNTIRVPLRVIDRPVRVLWIEQSPRWEYRFAQAGLDRDARIALTTVLVDALPESVAPLADVSVLEQTDVLILGDVSADRLGADAIDAIERFVGVSGGSLVLVGGERAMPMSYLGTRLRRLMPMTPAPSAAAMIGPWRLERIGEPDVATAALADDADEDRRLWAGLAPLQQLEPMRLSPASELLLRGLDDEGKAAPFLALGAYGAGEVAMFAGDDLWRIRRNEGDRHHARLWSQLMMRLAQARLLGGSARTQLLVQPLRAPVGTSLTLSARLSDPTLRPVVRDGVELSLTDPQGRTGTISLNAVLDAPGLYRTSLRASSPGTHTLRLDDVTSEFDVMEDRRELVRITPDHAMLRRLASATSGDWLPVGRSGELPGLIGDRTRLTRVSEVIHVWSSPWVFAAILMCVSAEWFLRRRWMLK